jgi:hypothetical protein
MQHMGVENQEFEAHRPHLPTATYARRQTDRFAGFTPTREALKHRQASKHIQTPMPAQPRCAAACPALGCRACRTHTSSVTNLKPDTPQTICQAHDHFVCAAHL